MTSISTFGSDSGSATIYQFPVGGRAGLTSRNQATQPATKDIVLIDAWYHQEAIRESQQATKQ